MPQKAMPLSLEPAPKSHSPQILTKRKTETVLSWKKTYCLAKKCRTPTPLNCFVLVNKCLDNVFFLDFNLEFGLFYLKQVFGKKGFILSKFNSEQPLSFAK